MKKGHELHFTLQYSETGVVLSNQIVRPEKQSVSVWGVNFFRIYCSTSSISWLWLYTTCDNQNQLLTTYYLPRWQH